MLRRNAPTPTDDAPDEPTRPPADRRRRRTRAAAEPGPRHACRSSGITRRRLATLLGALLAAWIVIVFARQVGEASAGDRSSRDDGRATTRTRTAEVAGLERELDADPATGVRPPAGARLRPRRTDGDRRSRSIRTRRRCPTNAPGSAALRVGASVAGQPARTLADAPVRPGRLTDRRRAPGATARMQLTRANRHDRALPPPTSVGSRQRPSVQGRDLMTVLHTADRAVPGSNWPATRW